MLHHKHLILLYFLFGIGNILCRKRLREQKTRSDMICITIIWSHCIQLKIFLMFACRVYQFKTTIPPGSQTKHSNTKWLIVHTNTNWRLNNCLWRCSHYLLEDPTTKQSIRVSINHFIKSKQIRPRYALFVLQNVII